MTFTIKSLDLQVLQTLDDVFGNIGLDTWREPGGRRDDDTYDVELQDAWLDILHCKVYVCYDDIHILLFPNAYSEIIIT